MYFYLLIPVLAFLVYVYLEKKKKRPIILTDELVAYVKDYVPFYQKLSEDDKNLFLQKNVDFINSHKFVGVETNIDLKDKTLIASSIVMMTFQFNVDLSLKLDTIYLSDKKIDDSYLGLSRKSSGFVRNTSEGMDICLNRDSLIYGFQNTEDNKNVGIHEFAHILDGLDGKIDGFPMALIPASEMGEWNLLSKKYMPLLNNKETIHDRYTSKSRAEFFAVVSELFFENPAQLSDDFPELYSFFVRIYNTDLANQYTEKSND